MKYVDREQTADAFNTNISVFLPHVCFKTYFKSLKYVWCCSQWQLFAQLEEQPTYHSFVGGVKNGAAIFLAERCIIQGPCKTNLEI